MDAVVKVTLGSLQQSGIDTEVYKLPTDVESKLLCCQIATPDQPGIDQVPVFDTS